MKESVKRECLFCHKEFITKRKDKVYCTTDCASNGWAKQHIDKKLLSTRKYLANPKHKKRRQEYERQYALKNQYGITQTQVNAQLLRQNYGCYGCLTVLTKKNTHVDHCHKTNKFRGMLCRSCNQLLGHCGDKGREAITILRRLMAYLDYDRTKLNIYLIGSLKNELRIPEIGNILRVEGYDVMDEWITPGEHADENWQRYEKIRGRTYEEALKGRAATNIFLFDRSYIDLCDVAVLIMPAGKSAFLELGYAKGRHKRTFILLDGKEPDRYDIMPNFAYKICKTVDDLVKELRKININLESEHKEWITHHH